MTAFVLQSDIRANNQANIFLSELKCSLFLLYNLLDRFSSLKRITHFLSKEKEVLENNQTHLSSLESKPFTQDNTLLIVDDYCFPVWLQKKNKN